MSEDLNQYISKTGQRIPVDVLDQLKKVSKTVIGEMFKYSPDQPRESNGRFGSVSGEESVKPKTFRELHSAEFQMEAESKRTEDIARGISKISSNVKEFNESGGKITVMHLDRDNPVDSVKVGLMLNKVNTEYSSLMGKYPLGRLGIGIQYMSNALSYARDVPGSVLHVATDSNGKIVGVLSTDSSSINWLGSAQIIPGTGSALVNSMFQDATSTGLSRLNGEVSADAAPFWESVGGTVDNVGTHEQSSLFVNFHPSVMQGVASGVSSSLSKTVIGMLKKENKND